MMWKFITRKPNWVDVINFAMFVSLCRSLPIIFLYFNLKKPTITHFMCAHFVWKIQVCEPVLTISSIPAAHMVAVAPSWHSYSNLVILAIFGQWNIVNIVF